MPDTTKADVATLLETFADYVNPSGAWDPWFTTDEINQQFAWEDIPSDTLEGWLSEMEAAGQVEHGAEGWRWLS